VKYAATFLRKQQLYENIFHMKESAFWASLKGAGVLPFAVRVESPGSPGMPDVYFSLGNGVTGWIELKVVPDERRAPIAQGTGHGQLRPLQVLWAQQASAQNIFTNVLLFHRDRAILVAGRDVKPLLGEPLDSVLDRALWVGSPTPRNRWTNLLEQLDKHGKSTLICMATTRTDSSA
jgi:hypothetical protein